MMRFRLLACVLLVCAATANGVSGQSRFEITPFAGAFLPLADLTDPFGADRVVQSHGNALTFGAHAGVRFTALSIEGTFAYVGTDIQTESPNLGSDAAEDQTILIIGGSALYNIELSRFMELFLAAGAGIKRYSADDPLGGFEAGTDVMFDAGGGLRLYISPTTAIRLDVRDYISTFDAFADTSLDEDAKMQHDVLLTVGLSFVVGGS